MIDIHLADCVTAKCDTLRLKIEDDSFFELKSDGRFSSEYGIDELSGNLMALNTSDGAYVYEIPSGKLLKAIPRDKPIANVVFTPDMEDVWIINGDWNTDISLMRRLDEQGEPIKSIQTRLYGDIHLESDSSYIATNGLGKNGGQFYVYRLNENFEVTDSMPLPEYLTPKETVFYQERPLRRDGENFTVWLDNDTLYTISASLKPAPTAAFDYAGKKVPDDLSPANYSTILDYYDALQKYMTITTLKKLGDYIFARMEYDNKVYFTVYDCADGAIVYNNSATDKSWGIPVNIKGIVFDSWPRAIYDDKLLFEIPADAMSRITGDTNASQGFGMIPAADFADQIRK